MFNLLALVWLELARLVFFLGLLACFTLVWFGSLVACLAFVCFAVLCLICFALLAWCSFLAWFSLLRNDVRCLT